MADRSSERDRRVRQLMRNRNPGFDVIGQAQAEIQDAQSELYNHIALQNAQEQSRLRETATISQAAQGMLAMEGGDQLSAQAAYMNPSTQATLGKYGVKPSRTQNTTRNVQTQRTTSSTGGTTNIRNENITNNRTEIKVTQPAIPIQQPTIAVNGGGARKEDSTAKFKAWLSGMFARQQNEADIQKKEYRKKEWALGRTTNKLMKKIGEATSNLGNKLDPKNMTSSLGGQLKWLLLIFGATMIGKVWKPAMETLANIEGGIRAALGLDINDDLRKNSSKALSIVDQLKSAIGIDPKKENTTLIEGIGNAFMQGIDKLIAQLQLWFEDRAVSMRGVEFPKVEVSARHPYDSIVNAVKGMGQYLGDVITVAFGGSKGKVRVEGNKIERQSIESFNNTKGKQTSVGDSGLITGGGRNYTRNDDFDISGNLKGNASSTQAMSRSLISMFQDTSGKGHTYEISTGVSQLFKAANSQGQVAIDPELLTYLGLSPSDLMSLKSSGGLTQKAYRIIAVKPNEAQKEELGAYGGHWGAGIGGAAGSIGLAALGAAKGAAMGSALGPIGTVFGGLTGGALGFFTGGAVGTGVGIGIDSMIKDWTSKGLYPKLVPAESSEMSADGSPGIAKPLWVIDRKGLEQVKSIMGLKDQEIDITNEAFTSIIKTRQQAIARKNGITLRGEAIGDTGLLAARAQNKNMEQRFKELDNDPKYGNWNAAVRSGQRLIEKGQSWISDRLNYVGGKVKGMSIGSLEQNQRAAWLMKLAMKYGFTKEQAAGIAGNAMRESSMVTETAYNPNDGGKASGGLVGWRGDNCKQVLRYARDLYNCNVNPDNPSDITKVPFEIQADILMRTLTGELEYGGNGFGKKAGDAIRASRSIAEATKAMERNYEISGDFAKDRYLTHRTGYAKNFYQLDLSVVDLNDNALGSPLIITGGDNTVMVGKSGSTSSKVKNWLWGGAAPVDYDPKDEAKANSLQVRIQVPIHNFDGNEGVMSLTVNKKLVENIRAIFEEIFKNSPTFQINPTTTACFCFRKVNTGGNPSNKLSNHSFGGAIDINPGINILNDPDTTNTTRHLGSEKHPVVQIFYKYGWIWGGVWENRDKMHFEFNGKMGNSGLNSVIDTVGDAILSASDALNPNSNNTSGGTKSSGNLSTGQIASITSLNRYRLDSARINADALARSGAKSDQYGVYIETPGGYRNYLNNSSFAYGGSITGDDVSFVLREDGKGNLNKVTKEEERLSKESVIIKVKSLFTSYKGSGSMDDLMKNSKGEEIFINLGEFDDVDGFSEWAKKNMKKKKIQYEVCLTKDMTTYAIIRIRPKILSSLGAIFSKHIGEMSEKDLDEATWIGPIIYHRGKKWFDILDDKNTTDWQPAARYDKVTLTPKAEKELGKVIRFINQGIITQKGGKLFSGDQEMSKDDLEDAKKWGLIEKSGFNFTYGQQYRAIDGVNEGIGTATSLVIKNGGYFDVDSYFAVLGTSFEDREKFYNEHKDEKGYFFYRDGEIIGAGGVVWGKYKIDKNGKRIDSLFNKSIFKSTQINLGKKGLERRHKQNEIDILTEEAGELGGLDYNVVGDFLNKVQNVDLSGEDQDLISKIQSRVNKNNGGIIRSSIVGRGTISGNEFSYYIFTDAQGNVTYKMTAPQIKKLWGKFGLPSELASTGISSNDIKDFYEKIIRKLSISRVNADSEHKYGLLPGASEEERIHHDINYLRTHHNTSMNSGENSLGKLVGYLKRKRKLIDRIDTLGRGKGVIVYYQDGTEEKFSSFEYNFPKNFIKKNIWESINREIEEVNIAAVQEKTIKEWDKSGYNQNLKKLIERAKNDKNFKFIYNDDGTISTEDGIIFDTWDPSKGKPTEGKYAGRGGISSGDLNNNTSLIDKIIYGQAASYFDEHTDSKEKYLEKYYGAQKIGNEMWTYSKDGKYRVKLNTNLSTSQINKDTVFDRSSIQWKNSDGQWATPENDKNAENGFNKILGQIGNVNDAINLISEYVNTIKDQGETSEDQMVAQILQEQEALATAKNQEDYLKILAMQAAGVDQEGIKKVYDETKLRTEKAKGDALMEIARRNKNKWADLEYTDRIKTSGGHLLLVGKDKTVYEGFIDENGKQTYKSTGKKYKGIEDDGRIVYQQDNSATYNDNSSTTVIEKRDDDTGTSTMNGATQGQ